MVDKLQFDTVIPADGRAPGGAATAVCGSCHQPIAVKYYEINGHVMCGPCRGRIGSLAETPRRAGPLLRAGIFGLGAGIVGAIIYYAVIAITNFEIGIVAILIGYMVGYAVRKGAGGGGRRFQILAVALTYVAVALAYLPIAVKAAVKQAPSTHAAATAGAPAPKPTASPLTAVAVLIGLTAALPVLVIVGGLPSSLLSAAIIFFGMKQAWKMTGVPALQINGPYRVGAPPAVTT